MTDFRDTLRAELVAAAGRPVPRRHALPRPVLVRGVALAAAVAAVAIAVLVVPWGADRTPAPGLQPTLPGRPLFGGSLDDGVRYATRALRPPISLRAVGPYWFVYDATSTTTLVLQRREGDASKANGEKAPVLFLAFLRLPQLLDPATGDIRPAPDDLVGALRANPDLGITRATRTTLFGRPATRLSFHVPEQPERTTPDCPFAKVTVDTEPPNVATCMAVAPNAQLPANSTGYLIVPDGANPLVVTEVSLVPSRTGQIARESAPVLQSVLISR
jgi:hypothetical protein